MDNPETHRRHWGHKTQDEDKQNNNKESTTNPQKMGVNLGALKG